MRTCVYLFGSIAVFFILSCASSVPEPMPLHVRSVVDRWPDTRLSELSAGRSLYILKCSGCHSLYGPLQYSPSSWEKIVRDMTARAHMTDSEADQIARYLVSVSLADSVERSK